MEPTISSDANNSNSKFITYITAGLAIGAAGIGAYFLYRWLRPLAPYIASEVEQNLPIAKDLETIPDLRGNYDLDGVSFDTDGVIVSGDNNKMAKPTLN